MCAVNYVQTRTAAQPMHLAAIDGEDVLIGVDEIAAGGRGEEVGERPRLECRRGRGELLPAWGGGKGGGFGPEDVGVCGAGIE